MKDARDYRYTGYDTNPKNKPYELLNAVFLCDDMILNKSRIRCESITVIVQG